jgi:hypothetical protein
LHLPSAIHQNQEIQIAKQAFKRGRSPKFPASLESVIMVPYVKERCVFLIHIPAYCTKESSFFFFSLQIPDFGVSIVFFFFNFHLLVKSHLLKHLEAAQNLALSKTCIIAAVLEIKTEIHSLRCDPNVLTVAEVEWVFIITSVVWRLEKVVSFGI